MSANLNAIKLIASFACVLLSAQLQLSAQKHNNENVNAPDARTLALGFKTLASVFAPRPKPTKITPAPTPPYNLTQQQLDDLEAIMSANEDIQRESLSALTNRTLQQWKNGLGVGVNSGGNGSTNDYVPIEQRRNFLCLPLFRFFNVQMRRTLLPNERVAIVGDHDRLGAWQVERAIEMIPASGGCDGAHTHLETWSARLVICASTRLHYRYFIYSEDGQGRRRVREWEGVPYGRVLERYQMYSGSGRDQFGLLSHTTIGDVELEKGWLRNEYALEFKFIWAQHMKFYRRMQLRRSTNFLLRMTVAENGYALRESDWRDTELEVSRYAYNRSYFQKQQQQLIARRGGVPYTAGDVLIFRFTSPLSARHSSYHLSILTADGLAVGEALILALDLRDSDGVLRLPILSANNGFQIGTLTLPYVIVRPLHGAAAYNMRGSFQRYWPMNWPPVDVGRRGLGASFNRSAPLVENTIASFLDAHARQAEMVAFEVLLTRDYVPVLWHDFGFRSAPHERDVRSDEDLDEELIAYLSYEQLKSSRVFALEEGKIFEYTNFNVRNATQTERLFTPLHQVFERLPPELGVVIEIKWPQFLENNRVEAAAQTLDKNRAVDVILKTVMQFGCGRPLIFASLDADICTMVRLKQNVFPVAFITRGATTRFADQRFRDLRTHTFLHAVNFAQSANLLGTVAHANNFLSNNEALLDLGLDLGQATFVWSEELLVAQTILQFKRWHVSGIIYDRIDLYGPRRKRESFFNAPELVDMFARQCIVVGHTNCSSAMPLPDGYDLHGKPVSKLGCEVIVQQIEG